MHTRQTSADVESQFRLGFLSSSPWSPGILCYALPTSAHPGHTHSQPKQEVAAESCSGSGLWLQARPLVADGEAFYEEAT